MALATQRRVWIPLFLALLVFPGCRVVFGDGGHYSGLFETNSFHDATETQVFKHTFAADGGGARLKVKVKLERGAATLRVHDATGALRWEKSFGQGRARVSEVLEGGGGEWRVELQFKGATGRYSLRLSGI